MDEFLKEALELVKAQASVRVMGEDEIMAMVQKLSKDLRSIDEGEVVAEGAEADPSEAKKAIRKRPFPAWNVAGHLRLLPKSIWPCMGLLPLSTGKSGATSATRPWPASPCSVNAAAICRK